MDKKERPSKSLLKNTDRLATAMVRAEIIKACGVPLKDLEERP